MDASLWMIGHADELVAVWDGHPAPRHGTAMDPEVVAQLLVRRRADDPLHALTHASGKCWG